MVRETGVEAGVLVARNALRLIYAPRGETAGWMTWPLAALARTEGRALLSGLKVALGNQRLFTGPPENRLQPLMKASRESQNDVSEKLSEQVLGALHELLRGLHRADPDAIGALARKRPQHLYEGLLTALMRLVFLLYAEDRDLLPTSREPRARNLWQSGYSVATLFARLEDDQATNPDTMDDRYGGWGQILSVFRLVHEGHPHWIKGRGGKLFDPKVFPFLEGGVPGGSEAVLRVSDGCVHRILRGLMTLPARTADGARERVSYRALDVEQIGSVYETVMGFTAEAAPERMICVRDEKRLPTFIGVDTLLRLKPAARQKWLKEQGVDAKGKAWEAALKATTEADLLAALGAVADPRGSPERSPIPPGHPILQPTAERRRSGSHYTPRSLTAPIVAHALAPAFERLGDDARPDDVLDLKVCDPACGSGAFLVEACRQIGERLERAWGKHDYLKPAIPPDEDEATHARRLVAQRCLYGVDRNPMAADLAKLSLWLATLAAEHEFTFLDHAIKAGDSLVGLTAEQIAQGSWTHDNRDAALFLRGAVQERLQGWREARSLVRRAPHDASEVELSGLLRTAESRLADIRATADAIVATFFTAEKPKARLAAMKAFQGEFDSKSRDGLHGFDLSHARAAQARAQGITPFHWEIEFPEVFEQGGFDAMVGNPPFAGKNTISDGSGPLYIPWLQLLHEGAHGNADLVAHFFRRAFGLLRTGGAFGLIATNTIGQGDTRDTGLRAILGQGGAILRAQKRLRWPGAAAVVVSVVHLVKGKARSPVLDGRQVGRISAYLVPGEFDAAPYAISQNANLSYEGAKIYGSGFTFDDDAAAKGVSESLEEMHRLVAANSRNADCIMPYIGGEELNSSPTQAHDRYVINFEDYPLRRSSDLPSWLSISEAVRSELSRGGMVPSDYPGPVAEDWGDLVEIVRRRVKPQRDVLGDDPDGRYRKHNWWKYGRIPFGLMHGLKQVDWVLCISSVTPHLAMARMSSKYTFSHALKVFLFSDFAPFAVLQSRIHEIWARFFSSSMKDDLRYAPSDCFETFPFPLGYEIDPALEAAGQAYHHHRAALMVATDLGMTKTYNRFHDPERTDEGIVRLRDLHDAMDRAVLLAYGWDDLAEAVRPVFLEKPEGENGRGGQHGEPEDEHTYQGRLHWPQEIRDEVLKRLLALNAERHAEEMAAKGAESPLERARRLSQAAAE
ncbi:Eco57I restriction-modification methylase domain-containing protein [Rubellimicrobium aerolatum]|uniref:site-specific DNA-methyltransferase (adenine-specific) n=1 Tax=Rubellimicrobium aerolatum TaxID=490979 RepID=A0ABW0S8S4_9RHOB|nr:DNA methyltransferase [Rubellimicrobium aerolatum]MBP1804671.1 hypothetical protein [Rubellimicrobium aerolatum]